MIFIKKKLYAHSTRNFRFTLNNQFFHNHQNCEVHFSSKTNEKQHFSVSLFTSILLVTQTSQNTSKIFIKYRAHQVQMHQPKLAQNHRISKIFYAIRGYSLYRMRTKSNSSLCSLMLHFYLSDGLQYKGTTVPGASVGNAYVTRKRNQTILNVVKTAALSSNGRRLHKNQTRSAFMKKKIDLQS